MKRTIASLRESRRLSCTTLSPSPLSCTPASPVFTIASAAAASSCAQGLDKESWIFGSLLLLATCRSQVPASEQQPQPLIPDQLLLVMSACCRASRSVCFSAHMTPHKHPHQHHHQSQMKRTKAGSPVSPDLYDFSISVSQVNQGFYSGNPDSLHLNSKEGTKM